MSLPGGNTLPKKERLYCRKDISELLAKGRFVRDGQIRCCYLYGNGLDYNRIMVSVPKKNFKRAVKRNLLKRRIKESYRVEKDVIPGGADLLFIYSGKEIVDFTAIHGSICRILAAVSSKCTVKDNVRTE